MPKKYKILHLHSGTYIKCNMHEETLVIRDTLEEAYYNIEGWVKEGVYVALNNLHTPSCKEEFEIIEFEEEEKIKND